MVSSPWIRSRRSRPAKPSSGREAARFSARPPTRPHLPESHGLARHFLVGQLASLILVGPARRCRRGRGASGPQSAVAVVREGPAENWHASPVIATPPAYWDSSRRGRIGRSKSPAPTAPEGPRGRVHPSPVLNELLAAPRNRRGPPARGRTFFFFPPAAPRALPGHVAEGGPRVVRSAKNPSNPGLRPG